MENENSGLLNLQWRQIWRLAIWSWLALFLLSWVGIVVVWIDHKNPVGSLIMGVPLVVAFAVTLIPGATALLRQTTRMRLLSMPSAAALSMFTLAFVVSIVGLVLASVIANGPEAFVDSIEKGKQFPTLPALAAALYIGISSFSLTFGLAFPLAMPLVCAIMVWEKIRRHSQVSRKFYVFMTAISILGWWGVTFAGLVLGLGG